MDRELFPDAGSGFPFLISAIFGCECPPQLQHCKVVSKKSLNLFLLTEILSSEPRKGCLLSNTSFSSSFQQPNPHKEHSWRDSSGHSPPLECGISPHKTLVAHLIFSSYSQYFHQITTEFWSRCFAAPFPSPSLPCSKIYDDFMAWNS